MNLDFNVVAAVFITILVVDLVLVLLVIRHKLKLSLENTKHMKMITQLVESHTDAKQMRRLEANIATNVRLFRKLHMIVRQSLMPGTVYEDVFKRLIVAKKLDLRIARGLKSRSRLKRISTAVYLGLSSTEKVRLMLERALKKEKDYIVKIYMVEALTEIDPEVTIPATLGTLKGAPYWYRDKIHTLIAGSGAALHTYYERYLATDTSPEIADLMVDFAGKYQSELMRDYLVSTYDYGSVPENTVEFKSRYSQKKCTGCANCVSIDGDVVKCVKYKQTTFREQCKKYKAPVNVLSFRTPQEHANKAIEMLRVSYPETLDDVKYLENSDPYVRGRAYLALCALATEENVLRLVGYMADSDAEAAKHTAVSLANIISAKPMYINILIDLFSKTTELKTLDLIAEILSDRIEFMLYRITPTTEKSITGIVSTILTLGKTGGIISFLNKNDNVTLEDYMLGLIKCVVIDGNLAVQTRDFTENLEDRLVSKLGLAIETVSAVKKDEKRDKKTVTLLWFFLFLVVCVYPMVFAYFNWDSGLGWRQLAEDYVVSYSNVLAVYSASVNLIFLLVLVMSFFGVRSQRKYWEVKKYSFMFKKRVLPSISIIAPAYNEEATIIESVSSLLHLKYPDHEVILVNDGSKDNTLNTVIDYFNLEKVDVIYHEKIKTHPVRGFYRNKQYPKLLLVDKANGGKADSLNVGINVSKKDYFCGIDADTLLESDALLKITAQTIDNAEESIALGGNIMPINGCTVDSGTLDTIGIPKNSVARFQTVEYLRAFMAGRIGWAHMRCLLIISGAFGLFKKSRVIEVGGYLTKSGKYEKDTVGEDMELVVRLTKHMRDINKKFRIGYAFNANGWTEVPESWKILNRQRDRWHRGLIDIITFHSGMLFNPKYGTVGLIAFPYYFIFEVLGPLVELQGYLLLIVAAFFGLVGLKIVLLLFTTTVALGITVSLSALLLTERETNYFSIREILILLLYAFVENFGVRQYISYWRVAAFFNSMKKPKGWGQMERKGFTKK